ncbi:pyridoxal phosphate-dependent aminotransferase [Aestuariibius sp. 2305UL40-4]|uniref:pyridoxal phosphate-dependent aminotransferase n=1 Tax=Aestuariibius violaceus TaxID=3234132 RepID=UPI00345E1102
MRNSRRSEVDAFIVMDVMEAARRAEAAGRHVIHMEVGQPGTGAPAGARAALAAALEAGPLGYTVGLGLPELRARIAGLYREWYGVDLDPARVIVTSGASGAFILAFSALFDAGERVGLGMPCYPSYRQILKAMSLEAVGMETRLADRFQPTPGQVREAGLDGLIVASPANPTGTILPRAVFADLVGACAETGTALISDEIYHGLHHGARAVSALELTDEVYVINSFSKYFSMTGWRVGWMVVPEAHVRSVERLAQNLFICAPHASQVAALAALECGEELEANRAVYLKNRDVLRAALEGAGVDRIAPPDGAFYLYADVSRWTEDSLAFSRELLDAAGVAATPGLDFDPGRGHRYLRFSYAGAEAEIAEGAARVAAFLSARQVLPD